MKEKNIKITSIMNKIEEENNQYINRYQHVLNGYIESKDNDLLDENNENQIFLKDSQGIFTEEGENDLEVEIEQLSIVNKTKNYIIKFFNFLLPFNKDIKYIKYNYNTTVLLTFRIYRFLLLMSFFTAIILLPLCVMHIIKIKANLKESCKYGFPCFLLYSSFNQSEALNMSITYGVWLMFYFLCNMAYYFLINSENNQQELYYQNNKIYEACSYLFSSWNFNNRNENLIEINKKIIKKELENYAKANLSKLDGNKEKNFSVCLITLSHIIYVVYLVIAFFIIIILFFLKDKMRTNDKAIDKLAAKDIIADFIIYIFIGIFLYIVVWLVRFFPKCEGWSQERKKHSSEGIKKLITSIISIISLIIIITYFTLYSNENKKLIPFLDINHISFFGCPGKYEDHRHDIKLEDIIENFNKVSRKSYSQCREEDAGMAFFIIFFVYFIFLFLSELLRCLFNCCCSCLEKPTFLPALEIINFFTANLLFLIAIYFIPFLAIIFPIIVFILYKFQFSILKRMGDFSFKEKGIYQRNNKDLILISFIFFNIAAFSFIGYFYFFPLPHFYITECYTPKIVTNESYNILLYNYENYCGPVKSKVKLSSILTDKMRNIFVLGWLVELFLQLPFIIILISIVLIMLIYRKYNPDKRYYEYIYQSQKKLINSFHILYEQISKRDILNSMLLKITQQKLK